VWTLDVDFFDHEGLVDFVHDCSAHSETSWHRKSRGRVIDRAMA
jgi:hypothetical protein